MCPIKYIFMQGHKLDHEQMLEKNHLLCLEMKYGEHPCKKRIYWILKCASRLTLSMEICTLWSLHFRDVLLLCFAFLRDEWQNPNATYFSNTVLCFKVFDRS